MYFIRKKRHKRDQDAGLIFHWRGFRSHHSGKLIGLLLACAFFAISVYAVKVETMRSPLQSKREGSVVMLCLDDPAVRNLLLQVEDKSPFPSRWDPAMDEEVTHRISSSRDELDGSLWRYQMQLQPLPTIDRSPSLISITQSASELFDVMPDHWQESVPKEGFVLREPPVIQVRVVASQQLKSRITGNELELPNKLVIDEGYGQIFRFQIALDAAGFVSNCTPLPGGTVDSVKITDRQRNLAAWLRAQRFSDGGKDAAEMVVGQLELQIEAFAR
ncbi:MAG: hypothetical protein P8P36_08310 [Akkermansiaceae bacterium]|nr:hypothetical protein [Akkermansiaceae bacterium]